MVDVATLPQFLSYAEIEALVARMTFMPGWELSTYLDPFEGPVFRVVAWMENSYQPEGDRMQLRINSRVPWMTNAEQLSTWVLWRLEQIMSHELREWFKIDGKMIYDPHDPAEPAA